MDGDEGFLPGDDRKQINRLCWPTANAVVEDNSVNSFAARLDKFDVNADLTGARDRSEQDTK